LHEEIEMNFDELSPRRKMIVLMNRLTYGFSINDEFYSADFDLYDYSKDSFIDKIKDVLFRWCLKW